MKEMMKVTKVTTLYAFILLYNKFTDTLMSTMIHLGKDGGMCDIECHRQQ
jgi:hypothetical protein